MGCKEGGPDPRGQCRLLQFVPPAGKVWGGEGTALLTLAVKANPKPVQQRMGGPAESAPCELLVVLDSSADHGLSSFLFHWYGVSP